MPLPRFLDWTISRVRSGLHRRLDLLGGNRQRADARANRVEDGVADRRRDHRHRRLAAAHRRLAITDDADIDFRNLAHPHRRIAVEVPLLDATILHRALLEHCDRGAPEDRALNLGAHAVRVDDRADVHGDGDLLQRHLAGLGVDLHVGNASRPRGT